MYRLICPKSQIYVIEFWDNLGACVAPAFFRFQQVTGLAYKPEYYISPKYYIASALGGTIGPR